MDNERDNGKKNEDRKAKGPSRNPNLLIPMLLIGVLLLFLIMQWGNSQTSTISLRYFQNLLEGKDYDGKVLTNPDDEKPLEDVIKQITLTPRGARGIFRVEKLPKEPTFNSEGERKNHVDAVVAHLAAGVVISEKK